MVSRKSSSGLLWLKWGGFDLSNALGHLDGAFADAHRLGGGGDVGVHLGRLLQHGLRGGHAGASRLGLLRQLLHFVIDLGHAGPGLLGAGERGGGVETVFGALGERAAVDGARLDPGQGLLVVLELELKVKSFLDSCFS